MVLRVLGLLSVLFVVACEDVQPSGSCDTHPAACPAATLIAAGLSERVGEDFGGGLIFRGVSNAGTIVVVDMELPIPGAGLEDIQKRALHDLMVQSFAQGFCAGSEAQDLFDLGMTFRVRSFGNDDRLMGSSRLQSCGG